MKCLCENDSDDDPLPPPIRKRPHRQLEEALGMDDNYDGFSCSNMEKSDENQDVCVKKKKIEKSSLESNKDDKCDKKGIYWQNCSSNALLQMIPYPR